MSILLDYKDQMVEGGKSSPQVVDYLVFHLLLAKTKHLKQKHELLNYLYDLETSKFNELIEYNKSFHFQDAHILKKEITTIRFLINSVEM